MLLTYEAALEALLTAPIARRPTEVAHLEAALGRILAQPVVAVDGNPRFDNSAVDGYGLHLADLTSRQPLTLAGTVAAGESPTAELRPGFAVRILTGAPVPPGVAAVVMQEDVQVKGNQITLTASVENGENIRLAGTDYRVGETLLTPGTHITAGVAAILAAQGLAKPTVYAQPKVAILTTGDELVPLEAAPGPFQLRDSNGLMLKLAAQGFTQATTAIVPDDRPRFAEILKQQAQASDLILVAGGASVGDRDYVAGLVQELGTLYFHGIKVRPGKPVLFGQIDNALVLGLPGNPASAFVTFHLFGLPLLKRIGGSARPESCWFPVPFNAVHEGEKRDVFARVKLIDGEAVPIREQGSFGLRSLAEADGLVRLYADQSVNPGDQVSFLPF